jgi:quercetin dioxygenase-like cupin family protein
MIRIPFNRGLLALGILAATGGCGAGAQRVAAPAHSPHKPVREALSPLVQMPLPDIPGKTFTSAIVTFPPGASALPHRHGKAFVYAYVMDGTVASRLDHERTRVFHKGQNWVEQPGAHHVLTRNTSRRKPARLLVIFVSHTGDKLKVDDPHA